MRERLLRLQTTAAATQFAVSVVPLLSCDDDLKRASLFRILESLPAAAAQANSIAQVLSARCPNLSPEARSEISEFQKRASLQQVDNAFQEALAYARTYRANGFEGQSARLFYEAMNFLPSSAAARVDFEEIDRARAAYEKGNSSEAADRFQKAFSRLP